MRSHSRANGRRLLWEISTTIGKVSLLVCLMAGALSVSHIRLPSPAALIPDPVWRYLGAERRKEPDASAASTRMGEQIATPAPQEQAPEEENEKFGYGSSMSQVRKAQGAPGSIDGRLWRYGPSSVRFLRGRVVWWSSSPQRPLHVR